jgi:hypothetical protein
VAAREGLVGEVYVGGVGVAVVGDRHPSSLPASVSIRR